MIGSASNLKRNNINQAVKASGAPFVNNNILNTSTNLYSSNDNSIRAREPYIDSVSQGSSADIGQLLGAKEGADLRGSMQVMKDRGRLIMGANNNMGDSSGVRLASSI